MGLVEARGRAPRGRPRRRAGRGRGRRPASSWPPSRRAALGSFASTLRILCSWQRWITGWSNTAAHRRGERLGAVDDDQDGPGHVQAPVPQPDEQVGDDGGVLGRRPRPRRGAPWCRRCRCRGRRRSRCSAKCTPSTINATRSSPARSAAISSARAVSVRGHEAAGHRRLRRRAGRGLDRGADRFEPGPVAAGRQLGHHPLHRQLAQQLGRGEQLVGRHRHLAGAVGGAHPRPAHRHPPAAQGDRPGLGAVPHRRPVRVVAALRAAQRGDVFVHHRRHHLQPGAHRQGQQALPQRPGELGHRHASPPRATPTRRRCATARSSSGSSCFTVVVPLLVGVLGGTPDTYQPAGLERGTATSTSTTTGTTSAARCLSSVRASP